MLSPPDVLVLGAGGVLGEAWIMGVLAGIEDATGFDLRQCEYFVGTSAGSIVAAHLAAGDPPRRPSSVQADVDNGAGGGLPAIASAAARAIHLAATWAVDFGAPLAPLTLRIAAPGGALIRALTLHRLPRADDTLDDLRRRIERSGARFDGRLRIAAVDRGSGRRVVFGSPRAPLADVAAAVVASCTVPWLFAPVEIGGREYVDGGVWSPTNLDAAPAGRGTHVLCLNPTASLNGPHPLFAVARGVARSAVTLEVLTLRRRGAAVSVVAPNLECASAMSGDLMNHEPRGRVLAAGYRQGLSLATVPAPASRTPPRSLPLPRP